MNKNYVIQWKSTVNGRAGRGTKTFEEVEANRLAMELNREFPRIIHEAVAVDANVPEQESPEQPSDAPSPATIPMLSIA